MGIAFGRRTVAVRFVKTALDNGPPLATRALNVAI